MLATAGLTYAEYARSGLFQLLAVAVITLGVLLLLRAATDLASPGRRATFTAVTELAVALTLVVVVVAVRRLNLSTSPTRRPSSPATSSPASVRSSAPMSSTSPASLRTPSPPWPPACPAWTRSREPTCAPGSAPSSPTASRRPASPAGPLGTLATSAPSGPSPTSAADKQRITPLASPGPRRADHGLVVAGLGAVPS